jgi:UDP-GlcNAc3NAcA epimerase
MRRPTIATVLGARPQFIKASAVSSRIRDCRRIREVLIHTGQHYDQNMSTIFFEDLGMKRPDHSLKISGGGHGAMTGRMLEAVERVLHAERPDAVLVYGDTNSTLAGALAAAKLNIPVAHVEAGLRSFNMAMPEEVNRVVTDRVSRWMFTPTSEASQNLLREGVHPSAIFEVGDVMFDVALRYGGQGEGTSDLLDTLGLLEGRYVVATVHRAENTADRMRMLGIVDGLNQVSARYPVVWPLHPRTKAVLAELGADKRMMPNVRLLDPLGYIEMMQLQRRAGVVATDSGGVQKEAFFYRVPCVTLRDETEWTELVTSGWNRLVPPSSATAVAREIMAAFGRLGEDVSPYGKGDAARQIESKLAEVL